MKKPNPESRKILLHYPHFLYAHKKWPELQLVSPAHKATGVRLLSETRVFKGFILLLNLNNVENYYCLERRVSSRCQQCIYDIFMVFKSERSLKSLLTQSILWYHTNLSFNFTYNNETSSEANTSRQYTNHTTMISLIVKQHQRTSV